MRALLVAALAAANSLDHATQCAMSNLVFSAAKDLLGAERGSMAEVFDSLQLGSSCKLPEPAAGSAFEAKPLPASAYADRQVMTVSPSYALPGEVTHFNKHAVSDIYTALERVVKMGPSKVAIVLARGVHELSSTITLDSRYNGLLITAEPRGGVVLSGGTRFGGLAWEPFELPKYAEPGIRGFKVKLDLEEVDQLFLADTANSRMIRARHPNGDPETTGVYNKQHTGFFDKDSATWTPPKNVSQAREVQITTPNVTRNDSAVFKTYKMCYGGPAGNFEPPQSFWGCGGPGGGRYEFPQGLTMKNTSELPTTDLDVDGGIIHAFHSVYWGDWAFAVDVKRSDVKSGRLMFAEGGWQEARGSKAGGQWYLENVLGLLDSAHEWYFDRKESTLYFATNTTESHPPSRVTIPVLETLIQVGVANATEPTKNVTLSGLTFTHSKQHFMKKYTVVSGGDWAGYRGGAVVVQNTEAVKIERSYFQRNGGNGLAILDYNRRTIVDNNAFEKQGDSSIVMIGSVKENDGRDGTQPQFTQVTRNIARDMGIWIKQQGFLYHGLSGQSIIEGNIAFNTPRAAININDGYMGGHSVKNNILFNTVRETWDHGPVNTWDRLVLVYDAGHGASVYPLWTNITQNFVVKDNYANWPLDHDDGSRNFDDSSNVLLYGAYKTYLGDHKHVHDNLYVYADARGGDCADYCSAGAGEQWYGNQCIVLNGTRTYSDWQCDPSKPIGHPLSANNTFYISEGEWEMVCADSKKEITLQERQQRYHQDLGSKAYTGAAGKLSVAQITEMVKLKLPWFKGSELEMAVFV